MSGSKIWPILFFDSLRSIPWDKDVSAGSSFLGTERVATFSVMLLLCRK